MAVVVCEQPGPAPAPGPALHAVYVVSTDADRKKVGEPLAAGLSQASVAWAADGKSLYVTELRNPEPPGTCSFRPE